MGIIIDILLVAVVVGVIIASKNKGFVSSCLDTISLIASVIFSYLFSSKIAEFIYNTFVEDLVKTSFKNALEDAPSSLTISEKVNEMIGALPEPAVKLAEYFGVNIEHLKFQVSNGFYSDEQLVELVTDKIAYNVMIFIVQALSFIVLFVLASLLIKFVSSFLSATLSKIPLVGKLDSTLGAAFGVVKGCIIVLALGVLLSIIVATAEANSPLLAIEESYIYGLLKSLSPVTNVA